MRRRAVHLLVLFVMGAVPFAPPLAAPAAAQTSGTTGSALYFAEGNTLSGWKEFITILNPNATATAQVSIRYSCEQPAGTVVGCGIPGDTVVRSIPALTRDTVAVFDSSQGGVNGIFTGVGATLSSNIPIVAERPMYMTQPAGAFSQIPGVVMGAHDAAAVRPAAAWYFPEGTTQPDFQEYLTLLNPNTTTVAASIAYSVEGAGAPVVKTRNLPPLSRTTIDVVSNEQGALGLQAVGVSAVVTASRPIVAERPLYFIHNFGGGVGLVNGATDKPGARRGFSSPSSLAFAEGNGLPDFEEFITILNVTNTVGTITINYLVEGQTSPVVRSCPIGAFARVTVNVSSAAGNPPAIAPCSLDRSNAGTSTAKGVAAQVTANVAITAERPMYFSRDFPEIGRVNGAHDVVGVAQPEESSTQFFFAEGSTRNGFDQFWTISNPNPAAIRVAVDYLYNGARPNETKIYDVPASSRRTVQVFNPSDGGVGRSGDAGFDFGARTYTVDAGGVPNNRPFGIERPFYTRRDIGGQATDDGHDVTGIRREDVFPPVVPPDAWPVFHQNNQRTAFSRNASVGSNPSARWTYLDSRFRGAQSPVVGPNNVVYLTADTTTTANSDTDALTPGVVSLNGTTGAVNWVLPTGVGTTLTEDVSGPVTVGPNGILYVTFSDWLVALTDTGPAPVELWRFAEVTAPDLGGWDGNATIAADGTVYVGTSEGYLVAVAPPSTSNPSPSLKWAFQTWPLGPVDQRDLKSRPALAPDGTIYVGSDDPRGVVFGLRDDTTTATIVAQAVISPTINPTVNGGADRADVNSTPALDVSRGALYIASDNGKLHSFVIPGLAPRWEMTAGIPGGNSPEDSAPSIAPDGTVIIGSEDGFVYAFNSNGTRKWSVQPCGPTGRVESSAAISASGIAFIGSSCGLFAYRLSDGITLWSVPTGDVNESVEFAPAIGLDGSVIYPTDQAVTGTAVTAIRGDLSPTIF